MEYSCICCGTCCQKYQPWLSVAEVSTIAAELGLSPERFIAEYTDHRWPGTQSFLLSHIDESCVFLAAVPDTNLYICRIHAFKPSSCIAWAAGMHKPECQSGLKKLFGITVDANNTMIATDEQRELLDRRMKLISQL